jgi:mRNA interferase MazF
MIQKGDVVIARDKGYASKSRPMIVLQPENKSVTDTLVTSLVTSVDNPEPSVRYLIPASSENGLEHDSYAMLDKVAPIHKSNFARVIGKISHEQLIDIQRLLVKNVLDINPSDLEENN